MPIEVEKSGNVDFSSTNDHTVYSVTSNRRFKLRTLIIDNRESSAVTYSIYDGASSGGKLKLKITVAPNDSYPLTNLVGFVFEDSVVVKPSAYSSGGSMSVGGVETQE